MEHEESCFERTYLQTRTIYTCRSAQHTCSQASRDAPLEDWCGCVATPCRSFSSPSSTMPVPHSFPLRSADVKWRAVMSFAARCRHECGRQMPPPRSAVKMVAVPAFYDGLMRFSFLLIHSCSREIHRATAEMPWLYAHLVTST